MDATAALDFAYEPACAMAIFANNMGRMTESLLLWNINEVGISRLAAPYCSYSTIMPQKRNPVALETLRYSGEWTTGPDVHAGGHEGLSAGQRPGSRALW